MPKEAWEFLVGHHELSVLLTIDTEGEGFWGPGRDRCLGNIERLPEFQGFCEELGLRPTYLVAYDVIEDDSARAVIQQLARDGNCEIGAHLHAWLTPPYYEPLEPPGKHPYLHEYSEELRLAKLETVTTAIEDAIGKRPTSYRGGRWSMDAYTMRELDRLGYTADTTVTPFISNVDTWGTRTGGINFVPAPLGPYHPDSENILKEGDLSILEVPVSVRPRGIVSAPLYQRLGAVYGSQRTSWGFVRGILIKRLLRTRAVTSNLTSRPCDLTWLVDQVVGEEAPLLNIATHSSELVAGGAPWVRTREDEERIWRNLAEVVRRLAGSTGLRPATLCEFAAHW